MKHLNLFYEDFVRIYETTDLSYIFLVLFAFFLPVLLGLFGLMISKFEDKTIQNKTKRILKAVRVPFKKIQRRKLRPAMMYFKHQFATIRTLFL